MKGFATSEPRVEVRAQAAAHGEVLPRLRAREPPPLGARGHTGPEGAILSPVSPPPPPRREAFLPVDLEDLVADLVRPGSDGTPPSTLARFCRLYSALHRARLAEANAELRRAYRAFDPDRDTVTPLEVDEAERGRLLGRLRRDPNELLRQANDVEITAEKLAASLEKTSPRGLAVSVDLDEFEELSLHYRGEYTRTEEARDWRKLGLAKRSHEVTVYRRLFLLLKLKRQAADGPIPERVFLKLFRDVPEPDLEMILPNTRVRMRVFDKLKLGVTGGGGTAGGVAATVTKIGAAASPLTWAIALAGLAGVLWRQISKVLAQRTRYMADLAQQLYFCNLDNNFGALMHLAEQAQSEESKEAILAFAYLAESGPMSQAELDRAVEGFLEETYGFYADYEVTDGLAKLRRADLLVELDDGRFDVVSPEEACARLDREWDAMFEPEPAPSG